MQLYTLSQTSLASNGWKPVEYPIPLYWSDGTANGNNTTTQGYVFLADGSTANTGVGSQNKLYTLNSNWSSSQKFAFEGTFYSSGSGITVYMSLYDFTSSSLVSASQISTTSSTATVVRSAQFTLTPGHQYGVSVWSSNGSYYCYWVDASLIVFP